MQLIPVDEYLRKLSAKVKNMIKPYPQLAEDLEKALNSPAVKGFTPFELALLFKQQDGWCVKCGECCRRSNPINFHKLELETIASFTKTTYKKLKKKIGAVPRGDGTFDVAAPCPFLKGNLCSIYPVRPIVCRAFPANVILLQLQEKGKEVLEFPFYCKAAERAFIMKICGAVMRYRMEREAPDLASAMEEFAEDLCEEVKEKSFVEAFRHFYSFLSNL